MGDRHHPAQVELKAFPQCLLEGKECMHVRASRLELAQSPLPLLV